MGTTTALVLTFVAISNNLDLPPGLLSAVCLVETNHRVTAVHYNDGGSTSIGVCQLKLSTAKLMGYRGTEETLQSSPAVNAFYAGKYLKHHLERYQNNPVSAVSAYNAGKAKIKANTPYVRKVFYAWGNSQ